MSEESGNSQPINLGFWKLCHSHDSPLQLALKSQPGKIGLRACTETYAFGSDGRELEEFPGRPGKVTRLEKDPSVDQRGPNAWW